jgi:uncharacterized protein
MADQLRPVPIQELKALAAGRRWSIDQRLSELESLTPIRGELQAIHHGNMLELEGHGSTIVTLCCDRCLQHFNHPLSFSSRELLWLEADPCSPLLAAGDLLSGDTDGLDLNPDDLSERLDPRGDLDPAHWVFEQLSLQLPLVNRCGSDCPGPATWSSAPQDGDPRWAALRALRP